MTAPHLLVHGYVRMAEPDKATIALACKDISSYCRLSGYRLGSIFIDRDVPDHVFARTGFTNLLDAMREAQVHAVVVPTLDHLSPEPFVRDALLRMIELLTVQVFTAYDQVAGELRAMGEVCAGRAASSSS